MTDTPNLGMPYIDGSQAQKHVTHNEALRILDAAIQIGVLDLTLTVPPASPAEGERHVVASGATGTWAGQNNAVATWQDGAWAFLAPKTGWCVWSVADDAMFVFDGTAWRDFRSLPSALDNALRVGVNTAASSPNLFSVKSNAALFAAIDAAEAGTGDMRLQVSKEAAGNTASVFFSENFSGRAEFGLVGADAFKLKVSPDGSAWTEAFNIDQNTGNLTLPRGLSLAGVIAPAQITADQDDYSPAGLAAASVLQISADAARSLSGLDGGAEGRCVVIINVGSQPVALLDESASSAAANRFSLGRNLTIGAKQAAILRYDGTAARWQAIAGGAAASSAGMVFPPQGRLTLQSGAPVMTSSQSGKTTLYYTPYGGNQIPLYDGAAMVPTSFSELSIATTDTAHNPAAIGASKINDWFVWNDSGTIRLCHGPDWTDDTTRSAGTALTSSPGFLVNSVGITNGPAAGRGTYVGTTRSNGSSQLDWIFGASGTAPWFGLWNMYNRVDVRTTWAEGTASWTYNSTTVRALHNSFVARVSLVRGLDEDGLFVLAQTYVDTNTSAAAQFGFAVDSTTSNAVQMQASAPSVAGIGSVQYAGVIGAGFHFVQQTEKSANTNSYTAYGSTTLSSLTFSGRM